MRGSRSSVGILFVCLILTMLVSSVFAADVEKKWRISFMAGQHDAQDKIDSDAANFLTLRNRDFSFNSQFIDPRDDAGAFSNLSVEPALLGTLSGQYAVNKVFLVEASVGYQKGEVGKVELAAQFAGVPGVPEIPFHFEEFRFSAGDLTRVPIQLSGIMRLRPKAQFNPYFGAGVGYSIIGFDASDELNRISAAMDSSIGTQAKLTPSSSGSQLFLLPNPALDLEGASIDARDTFEWHMIAGAEFVVKNKWSAFVDLRWVDASRKFRIGFNGQDSLGTSVPNFTDFADGQFANAEFGPVLISEGGLVDVGFPDPILRPRPEAPGSTSCSETPELCWHPLVREPDGTPDPGFYYVQGGEMSYDGFSLQLGMRYTFGK